ncbi:MAG: sulfite exporter TauE/SafE family protein [Bacteroidetes bacterium]|jgi:thiol:disulfide interchange protein|nr:sulfite exporter TauE/SafE family protein [Bacteroidota bacterium]MBT5529258.1 sulfite exporter TauE/SafE family protein [Cytophagia bacterium]MBT3802307.1 sulfite exporter TauE/SafE family protein [Bacteroidota bacterium]MBT3933106.1 sulfite exporter TauE/SafE family protein [Bacteroidota bacterium]MBT4339512.1 sulfite exporter TauE/SafE family protein [Bacteroidota bacterium]
MEFLQEWFSSANLPLLSAFLLGIMTAISPCPLATNITAIAFISKDLENKNRVFISGLIYTLGRAIAYTSLGLLFFFGASQFELGGFFQSNGEKFLGPLLIIIGILMLDIIRINFPGFSKLTKKYEEKGTNSYWSVLFIGILFALAFCPYSGVLFFGMLIPITITSAKGLYLPIVFAIATGLPVIIISYLLAYTISGIGNFYNKVKLFEKWFRRVVAVLFIGVGIYYMVLFFFI